MDRATGAVIARLCPRHAPRGVAIIASGGLGDTVLFALMLPRFVRIARAGEPVTVVLRSDAARMAFLFPPEVRIETVDHSRLRAPLYRVRTMVRLYRAAFRLVVSADHLRHPALDEALVRACVAPETLAMAPRPSPKHDRALARNRRLYDRLFDSGVAPMDKVLRWTAFADWLLGERAPPPIIRLPAAALPPPAVLDAPTVLIQPFSAVREKQLPAEIHRCILAALPEGHRVLIAGGPGDLDRNPEFRALLELPGVAFEGAGFEQLVPILRAVRLVISVDTACMHLGVAVGAPTLCLASAAFVGEIVPYDAAVAPANAHFVIERMDCAGCLGQCVHPPERGMYPCVARLDADRVVNAVLGLLAGEATERLTGDPG